jgi:hypothetical protein
MHALTQTVIFSLPQRQLVSPSIVPNHLIYFANAVSIDQRFLHSFLSHLHHALLDITGGTLVAVVPLHTSSLLFLIGGGRSPRYPPNKVILWDDAIGREVAELEFRERVRGLACRRGWFAVSLRRRVVVFEIKGNVTRYGEWDTCDNPRGEDTPNLLPLPSTSRITISF